MVWLRDWDDVCLRGNKKKVAFRGGFKSSGNVNARALLLSGPPGIGKTSAVRCIAKTFGWALIEKNASDVRNKKSLIAKMGGVIDNQLLNFKAKDLTKVKRKFIILMDEVDGMSSGGIVFFLKVFNVLRSRRLNSYN